MNKDSHCLKSKDGRFSVYDGSISFIASFNDGQWNLGNLFGFTDLDENFVLITDEREHKRLLEEAIQALGWSAKQFRAG